MRMRAAPVVTDRSPPSRARAAACAVLSALVPSQIALSLTALTQPACNAAKVVQHKATENFEVPCMISVPYLVECVEYDPNTGLFYWLERPSNHFKPGRYGRDVIAAAWNEKYAGKLAFSQPNGRGYLSGTINSKHYTAHRVAYAIMTGEWPSWTIDHINGDKTDNRFANLREATPAQQMMNSAKKRKQIRGVACHKRSGEVRFSASIRVHLGYFSTEEEAAEAYEKAAKQVHDREFYLPNGVRLI